MQDFSNLTLKFSQKHRSQSFPVQSGGKIHMRRVCKKRKDIKNIKNKRESVKACLESLRNENEELVKIYTHLPFCKKEMLNP